MKQLGIPGIAGVLPGELIVDLFAGGGGASTGIEMALGRSPDVAVNHNPGAIACHRRNHPATEHHETGVWDVDPHTIAEGLPVGLLWASPDCTYFSRAKGGQPIREAGRRIRSLPWVVVRWAAAVAPRVICMENVAEIVQWGPVRSGRVVKSKRGKYWREFISQLQALGYDVEWRNLRGCDYGAPTTRERLFLVARRDGDPIVWPASTHGPGCALPYRTAAECIDWSLSCPSIFLTREQGRAAGCRRPLADATCRRIARGLIRFVLEDPAPFVLTIDQQSNRHGLTRLAEPVSTITHKARHALVAPWLMKYYGGVTGIRADRPADTVTAWDHHAVVAAWVTKFYGCGTGHAVTGPAHTVTSHANHAGLVAAFLAKYYGTGSVGHRADTPIHTITGTDRHALVTVQIDGETYAIVDIGMRMLQSRELAMAQGFPSNYWLPKTKSKATGLIGNSVCPQVAQALVAAQFQPAEVPA